MKSYSRDLIKQLQVIKQLEHKEILQQILLEQLQQILQALLYFDFTI